MQYILTEEELSELKKEKERYDFLVKQAAERKLKIFLDRLAAWLENRQITTSMSVNISDLQYRVRELRREEQI